MIDVDGGNTSWTSGLLPLIQTMEEGQNTPHRRVVPIARLSSLAVAGVSLPKKRVGELQVTDVFRLVLLAQPVVALDRATEWIFLLPVRLKPAVLAQLHHMPE